MENIKDIFNPKSWTNKKNGSKKSKDQSTPNRIAESQLEKLLEKVMNAPDGQKHHILRNTSYLLGGYVAADRLDYKKAEISLKNAIDKNPNNVVDYNAAYITIKDGLNNGMTKPVIDSFNENNSLGKPGNDHVWYEPESLEKPLPPVLPINKEMLPLPVRDWLIDISERMQCPLDYVAVTFVEMIAALVGCRCGIKPKQEDDWIVIPNLWGAIVGSPSQLKSPSIKAVMAPLIQFEKQAYEDFQHKMKAYQEAVEFYKIEKSGITSAIKAAYKNGEQDKVISLKQKLDEINSNLAHEPILKRYSTNDPTIEKLGEICSDNPQGILVLRDEIVGLISSWDKPGREPDRPFYLEGWDGNHSYRVDRISRGTILIENLCISVFGGIQPEKLAQYLYKIIKGDNDGMIQRFQLMVYPDEPKDWKYVDRLPNKEAKAEAFSIISKINELDFKSIGAPTSDYDDISYFRYTAEAHIEFEKWITKLETQKLRNNESHHLIKEHLAKYRSLVPTLSLIFHVINIADGYTDQLSIPLSVIKMAIAWAEYLESHAIRIYQGLGNPYNYSAYELAKKISARVLGESFTIRDVQQKNWHLLNTHELIKDAIDELIEANWIKEEAPISTKKTGRPPASRYVVNPKTRGFL